MLHAQHFGPLLLGNLDRGISRSVVDNDHFVQIADGIRGSAGGGHAPADEGLFVVCGDNKRKHVS